MRMVKAFVSGCLEGIPNLIRDACRVGCTLGLHTFRKCPRVMHVQFYRSLFPLKACPLGNTMEDLFLQSTQLHGCCCYMYSCPALHRQRRSIQIQCQRGRMCMLALFQCFTHAPGLTHILCVGNETSEEERLTLSLMMRASNYEHDPGTL